jgi:hypothetical protein
MFMFIYIYIYIVVLCDSKRSVYMFGSQNSALASNQVCTYSYSSKHACASSILVLTRCRRPQIECLWVRLWFHVVKRLCVCLRHSFCGMYVCMYVCMCVYVSYVGMLCIYIYIYMSVKNTLNMSEAFVLQYVCVCVHVMYVCIFCMCACT